MEAFWWSLDLLVSWTKGGADPSQDWPNTSLLVLITLNQRSTYFFPSWKQASFNGLWMLYLFFKLKCTACKTQKSGKCMYGIYTHPKNYGIGWNYFVCISTVWDRRGQVPKRAFQNVLEWMWKILRSICEYIHMTVTCYFMSTNGLGMDYEIISVLATWKRTSGKNWWHIQTE